MYGIGGSSALLNGNGGGSLGYALFGLGTRTGGKTKEDKNMPKNVKLSWYFHSIKQNRMLFAVHFTIHTKIRADWHYPSKRGDSLLTHTSTKTDTLNWSLPFYIPLG